MNINLDDLTLKQIKEIYKLNFSQGDNLRQKESNAVLGDLIGAYVIVRSRNEGINAGFLEEADDPLKHRVLFVTNATTRLERVLADVPWCEMEEPERFFRLARLQQQHPAHAVAVACRKSPGIGLDAGNGSRVD